MGIGAGRMVRWAMGDGRVRWARGARTGPGRASGLPVMWSRLVELELRDGVGSREIEGRGLIEVEFGLGRIPSGGHPGRPMGQVEMEQNAQLPRCRSIPSHQIGPGKVRGGANDRVRREIPRRLEYRRSWAVRWIPRWISGMRWERGPRGSGVDGCVAAERGAPGARGARGV